jgi:micrococcal nuclease
MLYSIPCAMTQTNSLANAGIRRIALLLLLLAFFSPSAPAQTRITCRISYVSDGDTFHGTLADGSKIKIRLAEVDCPESTQAYGLEAKEFSLRQIKDKQVVADTDQYGRTVGRVKYGEGKDLSEELVRNGLAWHFTRYSSDATLARLEKEARAKKIGLWKDKNPVAPWDYRKAARSSSAAR